MKTFTELCSYLYRGFRIAGLHVLRVLARLLFEGGKLQLTLGRYLWRVADRRLSLMRVGSSPTKVDMSSNSPKAEEPASSAGLSTTVTRKAALIMHPFVDESGNPIQSNVHAYVQCVGYIAHFIERRAEVGDVDAEMLLECFIANVRRSMSTPPVTH